MAEDAKTLIESAARRFVEEVPALATLNLIVGVELHGRGDTQHFRLQCPELQVSKGLATDARVNVEMRREQFNVLAKDARVPDWVEAFTYGMAKATGPSQYLRLISTVVEKQREREQLKTARRRTQ
jgi:hypothetical protein